MPRYVFVLCNVLRLVGSRLQVIYDLLCFVYPPQTHGTIERAHATDIVRDMNDLEGLGNNSVSAIYSRY